MTYRNSAIEAFDDRVPLEQRLALRYLLRAITEASRWELERCAIMAQAARIHAIIGRIDAGVGVCIADDVMRILNA